MLINFNKRKLYKLYTIFSLKIKLEILNLYQKIENYLIINDILR